jgi:hypothetical protein
VFGELFAMGFRRLLVPFDQSGEKLKETFDRRRRFRRDFGEGELHDTQQFGVRDDAEQLQDFCLGGDSDDSGKGDDRLQQQQVVRLFRS